MSIIGTGIDIVDIRRISSALRRFGPRFQNRIFTAGEQELAGRAKDAAGIYAKRWAAKEACSKALGTGMRQGVAWRNMEVVLNRSGMPRMVLTGRAHQRLMAITPDDWIPTVHLSMSDDFPFAVATVTIDANPDFARLDREAGRS